MVAAGAAALAGAPGAGRAADAAPPVLVADLGGIPTSPAFRMNVGPGAAAEETPAAPPIGSHDRPPAPARRTTPGSPAAPSARPAARALPEGGLGDPFEHLRERLAQTLGATPGGSGRYVMRVSNHGESGDHLVSAGPGASAPRRAAAHADSGAAPAPTARRTAADGRLQPTPWDYAGAGGPQAWAGLQPGNERCASGRRQSPIDIRGGIAVDLEPIAFDYHPSGFSVIDNGHTVEVDVAPGNFITVTGHRYELKEFHFHRPSEERVDGRQFDMVAHLVHEDAGGHVAVLAVLLERGSAQPLVQTIWNDLPLEKHEPVTGGGLIDPAGLLPGDRRYYTYMGSLTTPPCTEGVLWLVLKQPVAVSPAQVDIFARLYPMNARPLQPAGDRLIKESN